MGQAQPGGAARLDSGLGAEVEFGPKRPLVRSATKVSKEPNLAVSTSHAFPRSGHQLSLALELQWRVFYDLFQDEEASQLPNARKSKKLSAM